MLDKLASIYDRYIYIQEQLNNPDVAGDMERFRKLNKEYKKLEAVAETYLAYKKLLTDVESARELLADPEMREMAQQELDELTDQRKILEEDIKVILTPKDPEDEKDVIFEIRSGTGGDEASLFAGDLYRMYTRFFDSMGWKTEVISVNEGTVGGYNKIVLEVNGDNVYGMMKFESGAHRVQRVPKTEAQGRIHTSAATVAVIPKMEEEEININRADLKIDTYRASGAGGQHINKTESAVRITHLPTGIVSESQDGRSQHKNKEIAMNQLYQRIIEAQRSVKASELEAQRRSLVGSGDRSEKIRTYNYPQNRVTDHRINLTVHNLDQVMEGNLKTIIEALQVAENATKMEAGQLVE
jgi:peptide chain release factor 1